jgi:uncharacterized protein YhaN
MRFARIQVERFGPFTDLSLDFSSLPKGLHVIHGPNEAGKSSFLRAVSALLFGYEPSGENWKHDYKEFKLSATLAGDHGDLFEFTRLKKTKGGLRSPSDEPIDEGKLHRWLGGLDRATFEAMFSLDSERLRRGGKEIADGAGDLGKLLFAASGLGTVAGVSNWLEDQYKKLYLPTGKNPAVNEGLSQIRQLKAQERDASLSVEDYARVEAAKREADAELTRRRDSLVELERERRRIETTLNAKDDVARRDRLLAQRKELASAPTLPADTLGNARTAEERVRNKQAEFSRLQERIAAREAELSSLQLNGPILDAADAVDRFLRRVDRHTLNVEESSDADSRREAAEREVETHRAMLAAAPPDAEWDSLSIRLEALSGFDGSLHDQARRELDAKRTSLDALVARLAGWRGDLDGLLVLQTPTRKEIEEWNEEFQRRLKECEAVRAKLAELERDLADRRRSLVALEGRRCVPSDEQLAVARKLRDEGLVLLGARLKSQPDADAEAESRFIHAVGEDSLIAAIRKSVRSADEVVDRLRAEADAVAKVKEARHQCERIEGEISRVEHELAELEALQEKRQWSWRRRWDEAPIEVRSPAVMLQWLDDRRQIVEKHQEVQQADEHVKALEHQFAERRRERDRILERLGLALEAEEALPVSVERARRRLKSLEYASNRLQALSESMENDAKSLARIEEGAKTLLDDGRRLLAKLDIASHGESIDQIADELRPKVQRARSIAAERNRIANVLKEDREQLEEVVRELSEAQSRLGSALKIAGVETLPELAEADVRSRTKKETEAELAQIEARLMKAAGGRSLDDFADEVGRSSSDELRERLAEVDSNIEVLGRERDYWLDKATREGVELERMQQRGSEAAEARQQAEYTLGLAIERARRYAVLRSAQALLESAVREYRERNETKVLQRARELFRRLTNGAYSTLRSDVEGSKDAKLVAVRRDEEVSVADLSEGARDQLFLALRLSALEAVFEQRGPMPVLADDLLTTFDDERTAAALETLAEFARKTQVLLLTHHHHVVETARKKLSPNEVRLHELTANSDVSATDSLVLRA